MKENSELTVNDIILVFSCIVFMCPPYLLVIDGLGSIINIITFGIGLLSCVTYFLIQKYRPLISLIGIYYGITVFSTLFNSGETTTAIRYAVTGLGCCCILGYILSSGLVYRKLRIITLYLEFCVIGNLISILFYPDGLYLVYAYDNMWVNPAYLLGHRNNAIEYIIPLLGILNYIDYERGKAMSLESIAIYAICLITTIITWSANALGCIFVLAVGKLLASTKLRNILQNPAIPLGATGGITAVFLLQGVSTQFNMILEVLLGKQAATFGGRLPFWQRTITHVADNPILGHGYEAGYIVYSNIGHSNSSHNYYMDFLYQGGILLLSTIVGIISYCWNAIKERGSLFRYLFVLVLFAYCILWLATPLHKDRIFMMFAFFVISMFCGTESAQYVEKTN